MFVTAEVLKNQRVETLNFHDNALVPQALTDDLRAFICLLQENVSLLRQPFTPPRSISNPKLTWSTFAFVD